MAPGFDYLIVGAGFAGSVLAERLASVRNRRVLVIDRRAHIGGNAFDAYDEHGVLVHRYGPHIFHTNSKRVFTYLSRFTAWRPYQHRVRALVDGRLLPFPINLDTINELYGLRLSSLELAQFFAERAEERGVVTTAEDAVVTKVGRELFEKFFRGYTRKQWGREPSELDASVTARVPIRLSRDDRYFTDTYQGVPKEGYTRLFERLLAHPNISVMLQTDFNDIKRLIAYKHLIYTGPIDSFFGFSLGHLPYRSLRFHKEVVDTPEHELAQPVATINTPNDTPYTRATEMRQLTGQKHHKSVILFEEPQAEGDPYYPIPSPDNHALYRAYQQLAQERKDVTFAGRLATYRYYNMDQVVAQALKLADTLPDV
jgi:UDP-galactopyranose mutase